MHILFVRPQSGHWSSQVSFFLLGIGASSCTRSINRFYHFRVRPHANDRKTDDSGGLKSPLRGSGFTRTYGYVRRRVFGGRYGYPSHRSLANATLLSNPRPRPALSAQRGNPSWSLQRFPAASSATKRSHNPARAIKLASRMDSAAIASLWAL